MKRQSAIFDMPVEILSMTLLTLCILTQTSCSVESEDDLLRNITHGDPVVRSDACYRLGEKRSLKAVPSLIAALKDTSLNVRAAASYALGEIGDTSAIRPMISILDEGDIIGRYELNESDNIEDIRSRADLVSYTIGHEFIICRFSYIIDTKVRNSLKSLTDNYEKRLIAALTDENADVREGAVCELGRIKHSGAVEPLIQTLDDRESKIRMQVVRALVTIKDNRVVEPLIATLNDEDPLVRKEAFLALGEMNDIRAVVPLLSYVHDKDPDIREYSRMALLRMGTDVINSRLEEDLRFVARDYHLIIASGKAGTESVLIKALTKYGSVEMAEDFLNSGNIQLEQAAERWADAHGYMKILGGEPGPAWGRVR